MHKIFLCVISPKTKRKNTQNEYKINENIFLNIDDHCCFHPNRTKIMLKPISMELLNIGVYFAFLHLS